MSWSEFVIPLSGVVVGGGLSIMAQWYVLRRQHKDWISQRWWDRKVDTYNEILKLYWREYEFVQELRDAARQDENPNIEAEMDEFMRRYKQHRKVFRDLMMSNNLVVSRSVWKAIFEEFENRVWMDDSAYSSQVERAENEMKMINRSIYKIKTVILSDLEVSRS